ncbi:MAG: Tat pathway signal protein [Gammaproteobacteria bacterium]|nr:MAG: Tat pathway signal protein [Gammaproteobacteria bacterium]
MQSFFDKNYQIPTWLKEKVWFNASTPNQPSRRNFLKSAAGAVAITATPLLFSKNVLAQTAKAKQQWRNKPVWLTLNAVLEHLLPKSKTGPSAQDINALQYLYNVVTLQPTSEAEITFIKKGVGWLNGYSQSQLSKLFVDLNNDQKESVLRGISKSQAGENWLSTLLSYIFEAMLTPAVYGGNPDHIGEKWLNHQAGFPLPSTGTRYYELPGAYRISDLISPQDIVNKEIKIKEISTPRQITRKSKA